MVRELSAQLRQLVVQGREGLDKARPMMQPAMAAAVGGLALMPVMAAAASGNLQAATASPTAAITSGQALGGSGAPGRGNVYIDVRNEAGGQVQATAESQRDSAGNTRIRVLVRQLEAEMGRNIKQGGGLAGPLEQTYPQLNRGSGLRG